MADRDLLIFAPGEQFSFELQPALSEIVPGTTLDIRTTLTPARGNQTLWNNEQRLAVPVEGEPKVTINVPLPREEGVYTVRVVATRPSGFRERFFPGAATPLAERRIQVVVLDARSPRIPQADEWETVLEIDPTSPRWWERLPSWTQVRRIPGLNRGPLGSIRAGAIDHPLGRFVELPPTVAGAEPHWQAYSLPLEAIGLPHLLEIEYPANDEQQFGISIVEPNSIGVVAGIGRDAGVYVEGFGRREANATQTHRLVFWPRTQAPLLLITNGHPTAAAHFGLIRVLKRGSEQLSSGPNGPSPAKRLVAAYLARPLASETFGAREGLDAADAGTASASGSNDWQANFESATRLADYVRYGGYNSAVVCVTADGRSMYPSALLLPSPSRSTADAVSSSATLESDGLELMLRVFDREGLALLPALQFAAPLPELEALRRGSDPQTSGLDWVGPDGRTWPAVHGTKDDSAARYNLLDPRVQQAMLHVVDELVERYGRHRALAGLTIQLSSNGYAQLAPLEWGLDDATVGRFERETGIQLAATGPERFAARHALLTGEHVEAWRSWRAARVAEFYNQVAAMVRATGSNRRLLITLEESFDHPQLAGRIRPNLLTESRVEGTLADLGIQRQLLEKIPGIVLCPPRYVESIVPLSARAIDLELNQAAATWHRNSNPASTRAALLYHRPQRRTLAGFKAKSPFKLAGETLLVCQPLAHGAAVREPYVHALLENDPALLLDGGELIPLGQEDRLREVRMILGQLPTSAEVSEHTGQPVVVRRYAEPKQTTLLVVNASPWHAKANVTLDVPHAATLEPLIAPDAKASSTAAPPRALTVGKQPWSLSLEPYAVQALRIAAADVKVVDVSADVSDAAKAELAARLADLANRDLTAPRVYEALGNPSFEPIGGAGPLSGWRVLGNGATAELDATAPQDGKTCLFLDCEGGFTAVESDAFPTPASGQLAMTVWVRAQDAKASTELRMVFEADRIGPVYRRSAIVGGASTDTQTLDGQWRSFAILVNDLPLESGGQMRVRFELSGPGEIWLDNVKLYDVLFPLKFYRYSRPEIVQLLQLIHAAKSALEGGRITDCVRLLEGYWPRFLAAYTPLVQPAIAVERTPKPDPVSPPPADQNQEPAPGISERIKRFVPFIR